MTEHFFAAAPCISWFQWVLRSVWRQPQSPSPIQTQFETQPLPQSPTGMKAQPMKADKSAEYATFLSQHFYPTSSDVQLCVPVQVIDRGLKNKSIQGVELRDCDQCLIGIVTSHYAGSCAENPNTGIITWLCVSPQWRSKGVTNYLLRNMYAQALPRRIHWWRNDGWVKSPVPPIYTQTKITRKQQRVRSILKEGQHQVYGGVQRVPFAKYSASWISEWKRTAPSGLVCDDAVFQHRYIEAWERRITPQKACVVFLTPTFEVKRGTGEQWCEVIGHLAIGMPQEGYEVAQNVEAILDRIPYTWIEAPIEMPHLEQGWKQAGQTSWFVLGLDPGTPVTRPVLSLCSA